MALRLNLYHEVIRTKALKRRDPLKISIYCIAGVLGCFALWYFFELVRMHEVGDQYLKAKKEFSLVEPQAKAARKREEELNQQAATSVKMVKRIEGRFYWAPLMAEFTKVVPREVQITRLGGEVSVDAPRRCSLSIDGLSAGADPRRVAEDLRTAIADKLAPRYKNVTSTFKTLEDGSETVKLDDKQVGTATFSILVQFTAPDDSTPPPGRKKK